jgi:hypothetical protein
MTAAFPATLRPVLLYVLAQRTVVAAFVASGIKG